MMTVTITEFIGILLIFLTIYLIADRICKCKEHCADAKSFSEACKNSNNAVNEALRKSNDALVKEIMKGTVNDQSRNQAGGQTGTERSDSHV